MVLDCRLEVGILELKLWGWLGGLGLVFGVEA